MNNPSNYIDFYNQNVYIKVLKAIYSELNSLEKFLNSIGESQNFKEIDDLVDYYEKTFSDHVLSKHIIYKIERVYKALYLSNPGPYDKWNSYFHLTLKLSSKEILLLDELYDNLLSDLLKFYKHLFSKVDNYFISFNSEQLKKYNIILDEIKSSVGKFLQFSENRDVISRRQKLNEQQLSNIPFGGLFYITHIGNIESILKHGILSHNLANEMNLPKVDISNQQVNERRNRVEPDLGGNIHDYTPLYFNHKNPMLYTLCKNTDRNKLILLKVNPHILLAENVAFSDGNASVRSTKFYNNIEEFNNLNWSLINSGSWNHYEINIKREQSRIMCSEALVKNKIEPYFIDEIYVYDEIILDKILPLFPNHLGIITSVNKKLYF